MAFSPFKFLQEVRSETAKVTWPSRRETTITTIMVFVMVALASVFFFVADQIVRVIITYILGLSDPRDIREFFITLLIVGGFVALVYIATQVTRRRSKGS